MILACSSCRARFLVADAALGLAGRRVRCGRCRHEWHAVASPTVEVEPPRRTPIRPRPLPPGANLPALARAPRRSPAIAMGWVLLAVVLAAAAAAYLWRDEMVARVPALEPVLAAIGLAAADPGEGLKLIDLASTQRTDQGAPVLVIEGKIDNFSDRPRDVPALRAALRDAASRELHAWTFKVDRPRLAPGEKVAFKTEIRQPSTAATALSITFVAAK